MSGRFEMPLLGPPTVVRFPEVHRDELANGLAVWSLAQPAMPVVSAAIIILGGAATDPHDRPGLASLVADLTDEGAGGRDAIQLSDAFARLGSHLDVDVGPDVTTISVTTLARFLADALALMADVVTRPHLREADLTRVRELRQSRLRQLSRSPGAAADRVFLAAAFGDHPYAHGALGTSPSLGAITLDEARRFWEVGFTPARSTLIVAGDISAEEVTRTAQSAFGGWAGRTAPPRASRGAEPRTGNLKPGTWNMEPGTRHILIVDRPGAPQSELRLGHTGPPRRVDEYHALVTLNAVLGGQFMSRINRNLREMRGITYGARTSFDMRRAGGAFSCETSVQADATDVAIREILGELRAIQADGAVGPEELEAARASLTRGYVRHFETAAQLARALAQLSTYELEPDTFDRFVPSVNAVTSHDLMRAARTFLHPDDCAIVVVGDAARYREPLEALGRDVTLVTPEF